MKNSFSKYIKAESQNLINTTVRLTNGQKQFLDKNRINLSEFVRDKITELILQHQELELKELKKAE